jgi:hypothetical protein
MKIVLENIYILPQDDLHTAYYEIRLRLEMRLTLTTLDILIEAVARVSP